MQIDRLMRRSIYCASLLLVVILSSHAGRAQQPDKVSRIGALLLGSTATSSRYTVSLREALRTFGHWMAKISSLTRDTLTVIMSGCLL